MWLILGAIGLLIALAYVVYVVALFLWDDLSGYNANQRALEAERERRREQHRLERQAVRDAMTKFSDDWHRRNAHEERALKLRQERAQEARINELSERYKE